MEYDPYNEQPSRTGVPSWVWVVGVSVVFLLCCVGGLVGSFFYLEQNSEALFGDLGATFEAAFPTAVVPTGSPTPVQAQALATPTTASTQALATPTTASTQVKATPDIVGTALAEFGFPASTDVEALMATAMAVIPADSETADMLATAQALLTAVPSGQSPAATPRPTLAAYDPYVETFDREGGWDVGRATADDGTTLRAEAYVEEGVLDFIVYDRKSVFWSTSKSRLGNGIYEIEVTAVDGPLDNGFGLLFLGDDETGDYYMFEISSDGYVWIGFYGGAGETIIPLVNDGWFRHDAVRQGLNQTNVLRVEVKSGAFRFLLNGQLVGQMRDFKLNEGDVGVFVETFDEGGVRVRFDNLRYTP